MTNNSPELVIDTALETNNLFLKNAERLKGIFSVNGHMSEDGYVDTFKDESKYIETDLNNLIDSIGTIDLDYMLTFSLSVIERDDITIYSYESNKMSNIEKLDDYHYKIPLSSKSIISKAIVGAIIMEHTYKESFHYELYKSSNDADNLVNYLLKEKIMIYNEGILSDEKYNDFIDELNNFSELFNIIFEQSEGSEMIVSTIYVLRKYLKLEWDTIFKLMKDEILIIDNIINELNEIVWKLNHNELNEYWKNKIDIKIININYLKDKSRNYKLDSKNIRQQFNEKTTDDLKQVSGIYLIYRNGRLFYIGEGKVYTRILRHFNKPYRPVVGEIEDRIKEFVDIYYDEVSVVVLKMSNPSDRKIRILLENLFTYNMLPSFTKVEINRALNENKTNLIND